MSPKAYHLAIGYSNKLQQHVTVTCFYDVISTMYVSKKCGIKNQVRCKNCLFLIISTMILYIIIAIMVYFCCLFKVFTEKILSLLSALCTLIMHFFLEANRDDLLLMFTDSSDHIFLTNITWNILDIFQNEMHAETLFFV